MASRARPNQGEKKGHSRTHDLTHSKKGQRLEDVVSEESDRQQGGGRCKKRKEKQGGVTFCWVEARRLRNLIGQTRKIGRDPRKNRSLGKTNGERSKGNKKRTVKFLERPPRREGREDEKWVNQRGRKGGQLKEKKKGGNDAGGVAVLTEKRNPGNKKKNPWGGGKKGKVRKHLIKKKQGKNLLRATKKKTEQTKGKKSRMKRGPQGLGGGERACRPGAKGV